MKHNTMDLPIEFFIKRLQEQKEYIDQLMIRKNKGELSELRCLELLLSAKGILNSIEDKIAQLDNSEKILADYLGVL